MQHIARLLNLVFAKKDISEVDLLVQNATLHAQLVQEDLQINAYRALTLTATLATVYVHHQHHLHACLVMF